MPRGRQKRAPSKASSARCNCRGGASGQQLNKRAGPAWARSLHLTAISYGNSRRSASQRAEKDGGVSAQQAALDALSSHALTPSPAARPTSSHVANTISAAAASTDSTNCIAGRATIEVGRGGETDMELPLASASIRSSRSSMSFVPAPRRVPGGGSMIGTAGKGFCVRTLTVCKCILPQGRATTAQAGMWNGVGTTARGHGPRPASGVTHAASDESEKIAVHAARTRVALWWC